MNSAAVNSDKNEPSQDGSYEVIDDANSQGSGAQKEQVGMNTSDFEHLSQYDPDDEFLQSQSSMSLLQSIIKSTKDAGKMEFAEMQSEYSIIDDDDESDLISISSSVISRGSAH